MDGGPRGSSIVQALVMSLTLPLCLNSHQEESLAADRLTHLLTADRLAHLLTTDRLAHSLLTDTLAHC